MALNGCTKAGLVASNSSFSECESEENIIDFIENSSLVVLVIN